MKFLLLFAAVANAAPSFEVGFSPSWNAEKKEALVKFPELQEFELSQRVELETLEDQKVETLTRQKFQGKWEKDRSLKVKYLEFFIQSKLNVPGFGPFENKQDLGKHVKNQELHFFWKNEEVSEVKGVKELREKILNANSNPVDKATLGRILQEDLVKKNVAMFLQNKDCLSGISGKKPSEEWTSRGVGEGANLEMKCKFSSWGEWKKQSVAKIEVTIPLQKNKISLTTGKNQTVENEGSGEIIFDPKSGESFFRLRQKMRVLGDKGSVSYSAVVTENHHYPK